MLRSVRRLAWYGTFIGAFVMVCGVLAPSWPLATVGLLFACAGVWNLWRPSITGLVVEGVTMILTGAFNLFAWLWIDDGRRSNLIKAAFAGILQIVWGIRRLALYRTARSTADDPEAIAHLQSMVRELAKRDARTDETVAEFRSGRWNSQRNRLGLYAEGAIGLLEQQVVRLEKRGDIWIEVSGTTMLGRSVKVAIRMSDLHLTGLMKTEHFERFERWKLGLTRPRPIAA